MRQGLYDMNHSKKVARTIALVCLGVALALSGELRAADECEPLEPKTDSACNDPNDTTTGDESGQMSRLAEEFKAAGRSTGSIGNNQANQCQNQQRVQDLSRQLSQLKGQACQNMITKCSETCEKEAQDNDAKAQQYQSTNPGLAQQYREKARKKREVKARCEANEGNVARAMEQAAQNADRANTNSQCNQQSAQQQPQQQQPQDNQPSSSPTPAPTPTPPLNCNDPSNARNPQCPRLGQPDDSNRLGLFGGGDASGGLNASGSSGYRDPSSSLVEGGSPTSSATSGYASGGGGDSGSMGFGGGFDYGSSSGDTDKPEAAGVASVNKNVMGADGGGGGGRGGGGPGNMPPDPQLIERINQKKLGGMTVQAVDGITGPMGASLFEKVSQQYKRQMSNFLPE